MSGQIIQLIVLVILLALSAFFSSAETALTAVNLIKIRNLIDDGNKRAETVLKVTSDRPKMLSAILIGNNIVNISASSLATTLAISIWGNVGAGIATGILTLLVLIFGEITPKTMATIKALELSLKVAPIISALMTVLTPVIFVINVLSSGVLFVLGVRKNQAEETITEEEIRTIVDVSHESGEIETDERELIHNVFDFSDACAKEIMIPRIDMTMIDVNWTIDQVAAAYEKYKYTRVPVYEDETDKIIGLINMKDLLFVDYSNGFNVRDYLREVYFTYEQKNISDLFDEMRDQSMSLAIVLDEYGSLAGMITLEDLLEELVGEIRDEYDDDEEDPLVKLNERTYRVLGSMNLDDLCDKLPLGFESEDYDTIGGYLTGLFDHFPNVGETYVSTDGIIIKVDAVDDRRITRIIIKMPKNLLQEITD